MDSDLPKESRVKVISLTTSRESSGYLADLSLHLNLSPEERESESNFSVLMVSVEALLPDKYCP